jgi:hypothetical protein
MKDAAEARGYICGRDCFESAATTAASYRTTESTEKAKRTTEPTAAGRAARAGRRR